MQFRNLLAAAMLSVLAACGGGGGGGATPPAPTERVTITATAPAAPVGSGGSAQFDVMVRNESTQAVSGVAVGLTLGSGLIKGGVTCAAANGAACPADATSLAVASLPAGGSLHFVVTARLAGGLRGTIASSASLSAAGQDASSADQVALDIQAFTADVQVSAQGPSAALTSGGVAMYTMTVANAGPDASSNLALENDLDTLQAPGAITCAADGGATCPATLGARMAVPTLPVGGRLVFSVPATIAANAQGRLSDTFYATPAGDPAPGDNLATAAATTAIDPRGSANLVALQSDAGDYVGAGRTYAYGNGNAQLSVTASGGQLQVRVDGNDHWSASFAEPASLATLQPGTYQNLTRFPFDDPTVGGLDWSGNGRGCNTETGSFTIDSVTYSGTTLTAIDLHFTQHCEGATPALQGQIHWLAADSSTAPGPAAPVPGWLWHAPAGATPASGNYAYFESDAGDFVGGGGTHVYTQANAVLPPSVNGNTFDIGVFGDIDWDGHFQGMNTLSQLQVGYYANLLRTSFGNPVVGGLSVDGAGHGCNEVTGWFAIDSITVTAGTLSAIDLRFEQHCEGASPSLRGQIHWAAGDTTAPPGPQTPVPSSLWQAPSGSTPASGNYVYLQSDAGDYIDQGQNRLFTQPDAALAVTSTGALLNVGVGAGIDSWSGQFAGMDSITQLQPGYYAGLQRYPFQNHAVGGLDWSGAGRGCNTLTGWFAIDGITYTGGVLAAIDLRFEQHCEGGASALHGKIHWNAADASAIR